MRLRGLERLRSEWNENWAVLAIGVGSVLTAAFLPAWVQELSKRWALGLGILGAVVLMVGVWARVRATAANRGTAFLVSAPLDDEEWGAGAVLWLQGATRFAGRGFRQIKTINRALPNDPGQWGAGLSYLKRMLGLYVEGLTDGSERDELSVLLMAPLPVSWALGTLFGQYSSVNVYQKSLAGPSLGGREEFFLAVRWHGGLRWGMPSETAEPVEEVTELARKLAADESVFLPDVAGTIERLCEPDVGEDERRAVVLALGANPNVRADALSDAKARGLHRALVVKRPSAEPYQERPEYFERIVYQAGSLVRAFNVEPAELWIYQSLPVSAAFSLGAFLNPPDRFHFMHYCNGVYEEATVR
ncbi:MAG: hypothetical protein ACRDZ4_11745 [Egibacteraceae bacterium]